MIPWLRNRVNMLVIVLTGVLMLPASVPAAEIGDHPLLKRYPGSKIIKHYQKEFDEVELPLGKSGKQGFEKMEKVKGKVTGIIYRNPRKRSTVEIYQNYEQAMKGAGFEFLFTCADKGCGQPGSPDPSLHYRWACFEQRHATARLPRAEGDIFVNLHVCKGMDKTFITVIESKVMETGLVKVDADAMADELVKKGHVSVYGILFDTDKTDINPASQEALEQIAKLLKTNPTLKLYVVGHTDTVGKFDYNMDLSRRRAREVVKSLASNYGISQTRLRGEGVGPLAPVASNVAEEGRAKNRRVELVVQ